MGRGNTPYFSFPGLTRGVGLARSGRKEIMTLFPSVGGWPRLGTGRGRFQGNDIF